MNKSRKQLIGLVLIFAIPTIASWFFYYNPELVPSARANKGELIQPVIHIDDFEFKGINNNTITSKSQYKDYWTLIVVAGNNCDDICKSRIHDMRQVRKALEEDYARVKRLVLINSNKVDENLKNYLKPYHGTDVMSQNKTLSEDIIAKISTNEDITNYLYIMDPMQNIMMRYYPQQDPKDFLTDMKRLLKINQWGAGH